MSEKTKIIIVDDHRLVRKGFMALLEEMGSVDMIGEAANGLELIELLKKGFKPDLVLLDYEMPFMNGLETLKKLKTDYFGIKVIFLTMLQSKELVQKSIECQVDGFLFKNTSYEELQSAINKIKSGEKYFPSEVALLLASKSDQINTELNKLSDRELEIVKLVAQGKSSVEIGSILFISPRTVDTHRNNIMQKMEFDSIAALVKWALKNKLID